MMARSISLSLSVGLPPGDGICRMPFSASRVNPVRPSSARALHAFLSPIFGAPSLPLAWQPEHTEATTCSPLLPLLCACADPAMTDSANATSSHREDAMAPGGECRSKRLRLLMSVTLSFAGARPGAGDLCVYAQRRIAS